MATSKWEGRSVVVIASGPSLTQADCDAVRASGLITVGVNSTWKMAPWLDVLYAGDRRYWKEYAQDIHASGFRGKRYSRSSRAEKEHQAKFLNSRLGHDYNSGELAIEMAIRFGASTIVLLGFDVSVEDGTHFHGDHSRTPNPNKSRAARWLKQFERIPAVYPKARIINCSRKTALPFFPQEPLEDVLARLSLPAAHSA